MSLAAIRQKRYTLAHPERVAATNRKYGLANRAKKTAYNKQWLEKNPGKTTIYHRKYREANPGEEALRQKQWREANIEKVREYCRKRAALKKTATIGAVDILKLISEWDGNCGICREPVVGDYHVDHKIPLTKGGAHAQDNLQLTHPSCNIRKGNKILT